MCASKRTFQIQVLKTYLIHLKTTKSFYAGLGMHQGPAGTEQILYGIDEQIIGSSGPGYAIGAHVVLEHVDEGGVTISARVMVWREGFTLLCNFQLVIPLSTQQEKTPRVLRHSVAAMVLASLSEKEIRGTED